MDKEFDLNHWNNIKTDLKKKYPQLTNADLIWRFETKDDLFRMIASKLGITKKYLDDFVESLKPGQKNIINY